jgi:glycine oxidase
MNHSFDVLVVGGGVIGCSTAYHLARKGAKVMVVEKRAIGGYAASLTAGILAAQAESDAPDALFDLCRASRSIFPSMVDEIIEFSGIDPALEMGGVWRAVETEDDKKALLEKKRWQEERHHPVDWQEPDRVKEIHPGLGESLGALHVSG